MARGAKRIVSAGIARFLHATGWLARSRTPDRLTILTFHRVLPEERRQGYPLPGLVVTPEELSWILGRLSPHYTCGPLEQSFDRWCAPVPGATPPLAITFDDCTADGHQYARPVLAAHDIRASFFAPAGLIEAGDALWHDRLGFAVSLLAACGDAGFDRWLEVNRLSPDPGAALAHRVVVAAKSETPARRDAWIRELETLAQGRGVPEWARLMTWQELRELSGEGHEIGSHSMSHELLPQLAREALRDEVEGSRILIADRIGRPIDSFCYPNGDESDGVADAVRRAGYRVGVTTRGGINERATDPLRLHRFDMQFDYVTDGFGAPSDALLLFRVSGHHPAASAG